MTADEYFVDSCGPTAEGPLTPAAALASLIGRPIAMAPGALEALLVSTRANVAAGLRAAAPGRPRTGAALASGTIAVITVDGFLSYRPGWFTGTALADTSRQIAAAKADPRVDAAIVRVDSDGGSIDYLPELSFEMREFRNVKPLVALVDTRCNSAAFWIAAQADAVIATPSAAVGSVGVWTAHLDESRANDHAGITVTLLSAGRFKTEGNSFQPLSDEARARIQGDVNRVYRQFIADVVVGRQRGLTPSVVEKTFGQGRVLSADEALRVGMIDAVAPTLGDAFAWAAAAADRQRIRASAVDDAQRMLEHGTATDRRAASAILQAGGADDASEIYARAARGVCDHVTDELAWVQSSLDANQAMLASLNAPGPRR